MDRPNNSIDEIRTLPNEIVICTTRVGNPKTAVDFEIGKSYLIAVDKSSAKLKHNERVSSKEEIEKILEIKKDLVGVLILDSKYQPYKVYNR